MDKRESLIFVESCIRNIQHEKDINKNIRLIESAVKREFDIQLDISIIDNKKTFFGMCIYPSPDEIDTLTNMLIQPLSKTGTKFSDVEKIHREFMTKSIKVVEIDSTLLYDHNINASAGEITAILLHELGHIVASNSLVNRLTRAKEYLMLKCDTKTRRLIPSIPMIPSLFSLVALQIFSHQFNVQLLKEKEADELAVKEGYGEELYSVLGKLIANGKGDQVKKSNKELDKDVEVTIDWLIVNIKELEYRKDKLKRSLKMLKFTTPSRFLADNISRISNSIFNRDDEVMMQKAVLVNEAFIMSNLKNKKMKAPSGAIDNAGRVRRLVTRDLDIYRAELERVNTVDDKIFLLERLYDLLDVAEYAKYMLEVEPKRVMQSEVTINNYIQSIHEIINMTNNKKISKQKYGLFIKYPADYEG
jgi:hypothetical protein